VGWQHMCARTSLVERTDSDSNFDPLRNMAEGWAALLVSVAIDLWTVGAHKTVARTHAQQCSEHLNLTRTHRGTRTHAHTQSAVMNV
jgi:hypothetical protein